MTYLRPLRRTGRTIGGSIAGLAALALGFTMLDGTSPSASSTSTTVVVTGILDGDTLRVRTPAGEDLGRVRLVGLDAPEVPHPDEPGECYGHRATAELRQLAPVGSTATLINDPTSGDQDRYGRLLRYVEIRKGRDVGHQLVAAGAGRAVAYDAGTKNGAAYVRAEKDARRRRAGMWGACR